MYKKVYVEITNNCNLSCKFCPHNKRKPKFISLDEFKIILNKLHGYTKYLYLHVLGEPLLHPDINTLIDMASNEYNVNITTNGYLIDKIKNNHNIRQINISLHSFNKDYISLDKYMNNIFETIDNLSSSTYFSLRLWTNNSYSKDMIDMINKRYNVDIDTLDNFKIKENVFLNTSEEFIWPSLDNDIYEETGTCYALKDHIGILADGSIVPCCLDSDGIINLGNIYKDDLKNIENTSRYKTMLEGFKENKKCEELCKHCKFNKVKKGGNNET